MKIVNNFYKLSFLSLLIYPLSFINQILISNYFGTSRILDHYWTSLTTALLITMHIGPIKENLVNDFHKIRKYNYESANKYLSENILFWVIITFILGLLFWFNPISILNLSKADKQISSSFTEIWIFRTLIIFMLLQCIHDIFAAILVSLGKVLFQNLNRFTTTLGSVIIISTMFDILKEYVLVVGIIIGMIFIIIYQIYELNKLEIKLFKFIYPKTSFNFMSKFSILFFAGTAGYFYVFYERIVFNNISTGLISSFQYAKSLHDIPQHLFIIAIASSLWPLYIVNVNQKKGDHIYEMTINKLLLIIVIFSWITLLLLFSAKQITYLVYFRGSFNNQSLETTYLCLKAVILCLVPIGINTILTRAIFSFGGIKLISLSIFLANLSGCLVLFYANVNKSLIIAIYNLLINSLISLIIISYGFLKYTKKINSISFWMKSISWLMRVFVSIIIVYFNYPFPSFEFKNKFNLILDLLIHYSGITFFLFLLFFIFGIIKINHFKRIWSELKSIKINYSNK